jgi:hypothetical protein
MLKIIGDLLCAGDIAGILTKWAGNIHQDIRDMVKYPAAAAG